ncbi:ABC transporter ATP-binding protein [Tropicibacter naphthalenivorans]|uniref:Polysialic acid transport ATP-binding protein KpsT n=1 Tax=Tropicibacter naphthalenivorans TaxID=441103 RepID=A0A0P1GKQ3_9RHOB|nr:ABC transporter ATP-binding protein [Tropicibacter naphthalenivorans]CUH82619.1 Polysialic acid transport ATP-binding protein KpsT [Tropicibacter naphthalenivorans]SMD08899.1 capsular polysaccharide transport system ATP-binding protein [Tropicibacter naphthalenivorans]
MIRFENLSKSFWVRGRQKVVIDHLDLTLPTGRSLALLGRNGAGKSTLLSIIAGALPADTGRVISDGTISWPVGLGGSFHPQMTGAQNVRFVARVYGVDTESLLHFVKTFAELGPQFYNPVKTYSAGMKARLGFGLSMGIKFDTYLIDETTAVGDARFNRKSRAVFHERMRGASSIVVSHQMNTVRAFCDSGIVLNRGKLEYFDDLEAAIDRHLKLNG